MCTVILHDEMQSLCTDFSLKKAALCFQWIVKSILHEKTVCKLLIEHYVFVQSGYVCDHATLL